MHMQDSPPEPADLSFKAGHGTCQATAPRLCWPATEYALAHDAEGAYAVCGNQQALDSWSV